MFLVSACLAGVNCRYDGGNCYNKDIYEMVNKGLAIPICPEIIGGLPTPREPMETMDNNVYTKIIDKDGNNYTELMLKGADECLRFAKLNNVKVAILKSKSPSCGFGQVYNGEFNGSLIKGNGITSELLAKNGIKIYNEYNYSDVL